MMHWIYSKMTIIWFSWMLLAMGCTQFPLSKKPQIMRTTHATLWLQSSGEAQALRYQAFNIARLRLDQYLRSPRPGPKQPAIVVDVDETVLDNNPYQARAIVTGESYPTGWPEWIERVKAEALPGAREFLRYAAKRQVAIFYITNRKQGGRAATLSNLKAQGFPVKPEWVMLRKDTKSKVLRRKKVLQDHHIVLLLGDTLGDFAEIFESQPTTKRNQAVDQMRQHFGHRFIVLPNPIYGDWEASLYDYQMQRSELERARLIKQRLRFY